MIAVTKTTLIQTKVTTVTLLVLNFVVVVVCFVCADDVCPSIKFTIFSKAKNTVKFLEWYKSNDNDKQTSAVRTLK
jgi:hypothetical protein